MVIARPNSPESVLQVTSILFTEDSDSVCRAQVFAGFSVHGDSVHNIIPLLKKENVHLYICL